jgi:DNA-directed RNA polymerase subunit beta'
VTASHLGPLNPHELLRLRGVRGVQEYLIQEIQAVYKAQGVDIDDKHLEIIIRQIAAQTARD